MSKYIQATTNVITNIEGLKFGNVLVRNFDKELKDRGRVGLRTACRYESDRPFPMVYGSACKPSCVQLTPCYVREPRESHRASCKPRQCLILSWEAVTRLYWSPFLPRFWLICWCVWKVREGFCDRVWPKTF